MKINRYMYGSRNEGLLKEQRSRMRSPEQVAAEAYAPYGAVADVAGTASDVIMEVENNRRIAIDADDKATAELNIAQADQSRKQIIEIAEMEGWGAEKTQTALDAVTENLLSTSETVSERNREEYVKNITALSGAYQFQNAANYNYMKFQDAVKKTDIALQDALTAENWELARGIIQGAQEDGRYSDERIRELTDVVNAGEEGSELFTKYQKAFEQGTENDFLANLTEQEISRGGMAVFLEKKKEYDGLMRGQEAEKEQREQEIRDRSTVNLGQNISYAEITTEDDLMNYVSTFSDENLHAFADEQDLTFTQRQQLFNKRNQRLKEIASRGNKSAGGDIEPDLTSKSYRDSITTEAASIFQIDPATATPQQRDQVVAYETLNAEKFGAIGTTTTNFLNNSATGGARGDVEGWEQFLRALPTYEKLASTDNIVWEGVDPDNISMYETIRYMNYQENPDLARQVWVNYNSASQQELDDAEAQYNPDDLMAELMDNEDIAGSAGLLRPDTFLWFNEEPDIPGATQSLIYRTGKTLSTHEALTSGVVSYRNLAEKVANVMGSMITSSTLNKGAPVGSDGMKSIGIEAMVHAPVKQEGEAWAREVLAQDFLGLDYKTGDGKFYWTEEGEKKKAGQIVKVFNELMTIVPPYDVQTADRAQQDMGLPFGGSINETMPDPYFDVEGGVVPVNWIQVVTPPLAQDQFNSKGQRIWHLYYRGKPILKEDNTYIEWSPFIDPDTGASRVMEENANQ